MMSHTEHLLQRQEPPEDVEAHSLLVQGYRVCMQMSLGIHLLYVVDLGTLESQSAAVYLNAACLQHT